MKKNERKDREQNAEPTQEDLMNFNAAIREITRTEVGTNTNSLIGTNTTQQMKDMQFTARNKRTPRSRKQLQP